MKTRSLSLRCVARRFLAGILVLFGLGGVDRAAAIEDPFAIGYTDRVSYAPGESVRFHLSARIDADVLGLRIVRVGRERLEKAVVDGIRAVEHAVPENASSHGCGWPVAASVMAAADWESGYYEAVPFWSAGDGSAKSGMPIRFVMRPSEPGKAGAILLHLTTNTENAYCNFGGYSLYAYNGKDGVQGHRVSFHRPMSGFANTWELPFIRWAEANGYRLDYCANGDLEFHPELLGHYRLVISVGHDEYWSKGMRDNLEAYIEQGGNAAFFTGNTCCWQVRFEDEGRAMVSWKQKPENDPLFSDPSRHGELSTLWSHHLVNRPETRLLGGGFLFGGYHRSHGQYMDGSGALTVHRADHWVFEGTQLGSGDAFGGQHTIVGYECDGCEFELVDGLPVPTGSDGAPKEFAILATAPARWHPDDSEWYERWEKGREGAACLGVIERDKGGVVFSTGTTDWSHGLAGGDPVVERITRNVLDRLSGFDVKAGRDAETSRTMMVVREGFVIEEMAAEPMVSDPVAFDWDAEGRMWVAQMNDYPLADTGGRISVLEDTDGDGRYDESTVFLEGVPFPSGIMTWRDGVIVTAAPEIFFAADRDGDGRADVRETLYSGFREGNQQHRVNGPRFTLDNRVSIANGDSGGTVTSPRTGERLELRGRDLLIDPDTGGMESLSGMTQFGRNRDDWGNWFGCNNPNPGWHYVVEERYVAEGGGTQPPFIRRDLTADRNVFPISLPLLHSIDLVEPAPGRPGRFTAACGIHVLRDARWGDEFDGNVFVSEPVYNAVHRMVPVREGATFRGERAAGEEAREFLASRDPWFRPTEIRTGPDGALWIADMYRFVLEHPEWIPDGLKNQLDLYAGSDRGRIYRIHPRAMGTPTIPKFAGCDGPALAALLESPNGWVRDKAQRMLVERGADPGTVEAVRGVLRWSGVPQARLHALYVLQGLGRLNPEDVASAAEDAHSEIRRHGFRLAEDVFDDVPGPIGDAAAGDDPVLAFQALLSVRAWASTAAGARVLALGAHRWGADPLFRWAVLSSSSGVEPAVLEALAVLSGDVDDEMLAGLAGGAPVEVRERAWEDLKQRRPPEEATADDLRLAAALLAGTSARAGNDWVGAAARMVAEPSREAPDRLAAARLLGVCAPHSAPALEALVDAYRVADPELRDEMAAVVSAVDDPDVGRMLVADFGELDVPLRNAVARLLAQRATWSGIFLEAVAADSTLTRGMAPDALRGFREHRDEAVRMRAVAVLGDDVRPDRAAVFEGLRAAADGSIPGDAESGRAVYAERCAICHDARPDGGGRIGPDLAMLENPSRSEVLAAIIDPNRAVEEKYLQHVVALADGRTLVGAIADESAGGLRLRTVDGAEHAIARGEIESTQPLGVSLMPEGLELGMDVGDMAGLLAFLTEREREPKRFPGNEPALIRMSGDDEDMMLPAARAAIFGPSLVFEQQFQNLGFWASQDDVAEWRLAVEGGGRFEVWAEIACVAEFAWQEFRIEIAGGHLAESASNTSGWENYNWRYVGNADIPSGETTVRVRSGGRIRGYLMDLRALKLVRIAE